jgi:hypothetical protein
VRARFPNGDARWSAIGVNDRNTRLGDKTALPLVCKGTVWVPFKMSAALHEADEIALTMRPTRMTIWPTA